MIHYPKTREEWLALRHKYVSSTESAGLKGLSPYITAFELFHDKAQKEPTAFESSERMEWGTRLEETIAKGIAEKYGLKVRKLNAYVSRDGTGMGSSFDFEIVGIKDDAEVDDPCLQEMYIKCGAGILEIKNVDYFIFKREWATFDDQREAPTHIEIQVQHQLHVIEREWAAIGVLVGGNKLEMLIRDYDPEVGASLEETVKKFWKDLKAGKRPPPELPQDANLLMQIYNYSEPGKVIDAQGDGEQSQALEKACKQYQQGMEYEKMGKDLKEIAKAEIIMIIGDAEKAVVRGGFKISAGLVGETQVPAFTRKAYRNIRVTHREVTT